MESAICYAYDTEVSPAGGFYLAGTQYNAGVLLLVANNLDQWHEWISYTKPCISLYVLFCYAVLYFADCVVDNIMHKIG